MKRILLTLAAICLCSLAVDAQTVDRLFADGVKETGVERVKIGKAGMWLAGLLGNTIGVKGIDVLEFGRCHPSVREKLNRTIRSLNDPKYELLMTANDDGEYVRVLIRTKKGNIRELVVLTTTANDATIVRIRGKINLSDLKQFISR
ncbi:MAG: DUF4252 domain-containing protein [Tannerella sp.]|jgi:hypothetical protein|nr:DUF4252 domain-containing protein [Tannerella sp.]